MTTVRFGVVGSGQQPERMPEAAFFRTVARTVEDLGYDSLWATDHLSFAHPILEGLVALSFFAGCTQRLELGTGIYLLPLRHPSVVAKQVASLDVLAGGRVLFGIGVGGESDRDFAAVGIPAEERGARADEAIDAVRTLWTRRSASFHGRFFRFDDVTIDPPPVRVPPIWVGGRAPKALARAGRRGDGWLAYLQSVGGFTQGLTTVRQEAADAGRDPAAVTGAVMLPVLVRSDGTRARRELAEHMAARYGRPFAEHQVDRLCLAGTTAACLDRLGAYLDAGARHVVLNPAGPPATFVDDVTSLAEDVVAPLRGRAAAAAPDEGSRP